MDAEKKLAHVKDEWKQSLKHLVGPKDSSRPEHDEAIRQYSKKRLKDTGKGINRLQNNILATKANRGKKPNLPESNMKTFGQLLEASLVKTILSLTEADKPVFHPVNGHEMEKRADHTWGYKGGWHGAPQKKKVAEAEAQVATKATAHTPTHDEYAKMSKKDKWEARMPSAPKEPTFRSRSSIASFSEHEKGSK